VRSSPSGVTIFVGVYSAGEKQQQQNKQTKQPQNKQNNNNNTKQHQQQRFACSPRAHVKL
jgi:hypothetical protein